MLDAVVERLIKALRNARPRNVRQFFQIANQHMRWELNEASRRFDEQTHSVEMGEHEPASPEASTSQLGPTANTVSQAIDFQKRADSLKNVKIGSLTYLGGLAFGGAGVHLYVIETDNASGPHLVSFALTIYQGRVVVVTQS